MHAIALADDFPITGRPHGSGQWRAYEKEGRPQGTLREDPFRPGHYEFRDPQGHKEFTVRPDPFREGEYRIEEEEE